MLRLRFARAGSPRVIKELPEDSLIHTGILAAKSERVLRRPVESCHATAGQVTGGQRCPSWSSQLL